MDRLAFLQKEASFNIKAIRALQVPGYENLKPFLYPSANPESDTLQRFKELYRPDFFGEIGSPGELMALCNKRPPHSITDIMLIQADDDMRSKFQDLNHAQQVIVLDATRLFIDYVSSEVSAGRIGPGIAHATYNISPDTRDRENSMGYTKRFHLHLNYWPTEQIAKHETEDVANLNPKLRREFVDPFTDLASQILVEEARTKNWFDGAPYFIVNAMNSQSLSLPPSFAISLPSWRYIATEGFRQSLVEMQCFIDRYFSELRKAFTGQNTRAPDWTRHRLLPQAEIVARLREKHRPIEIQQTLESLVCSLRSLSVETCTHLRDHPSARRRVMLMNGANYSVGFYAPTENSAVSPLNAGSKPYLLVQFKMLSTLGSAGLFPSPHAPIVRILRNSGGMTQEQQEYRNAFQENYRKYLEKSGIAVIYSDV